jgi:hypothetical protein
MFPLLRLMACCLCFFKFSPHLTLSAQEAQQAPLKTEPSSVGPAPKNSPNALVTFTAMGDVPRERADEGLLVRQLADLPSDVEFVVHLGDIKSGSTACDERTYLKVAGLLATSRVPVLIIPGDNEWNDCEHPGSAWPLWLKYFSRFERHWELEFPFTRFPQRDELFSFVHGDVLFIGLNLVGGRVHDSLEWKLRLADNAEWTRLNFRHFGANAERVVVLGHAKITDNHTDYFSTLVKQAQQFGKPVLYLHGDGHRWSKRYPWKAENLLAVQVDEGSMAPPVQITVTDDDTQPFVFDRRLESKQE